MITVGLKHIKLRKNSIFCIALMLFAVLMYGQKENINIAPKSYIAHYTDESIIIDGEPSETSWDKAKSTDLFVDIEGVKIPKYKTTVKMLWDNENFYLFAEMEEPHVWGNLKQKDTIIFYNNDFEVFIDPDNDTHNYYEFEINALNTLWDLFITKPYREGTPVLNDWDANGFQSSVKVQGTLNDPSDTDKAWSIEMAIPFSVFKTSYYHKNIPKDTFWRVNFSRVNWDFDLQNNKYVRKKDDKGKFKHEYNWVWSPIGVINMHQPEDWGYVYFSSKKIGEQDEFKIPKDEKVKKLLYHFYRKQKEYYKKNNEWASTFQELIQDTPVIEGNKVIHTIENHQTGWNITVVSPFTNHLYVIKEDGKIIQKED
ncbi:carbohydrate-binding family 9-like protein [Aquimarina sp. 2201CG5-10]|uniref:carbohydrate-binding family 9-like protein n=1 Tax=Aquimarina callyspongiae TaxID=3098150 RepID=UPI002AB51A90|nr:carbohydrate-binding family 9-like protein [Aquimarina sp. 2201CG5-10]MDY8138393.1 carbohydrate-binding family 9-like protein [Aquimarina sp. 2201CG5-10]